MSSLRNAVKRITHKERSQPQSRAHLGFLEKHKDYKERAKDFHRKQDRIQSLKEKASMRNPDEFYFGMKNAQVKDGQHKKTLQARNKEMEHQFGADAVRIMKDQDLSYVRMQKQKDRKKMDRLQTSLHYLDRPSTTRKHTVFVDSQDEAKDFDVAQHFETIPEMAGRAFNRRRVSELQKEVPTREAGWTENALKADQKAKKRLARKLARARSGAYTEMEARSKRIQVMERAEAHLETDKVLAAKGRKRKIKDAENGQPAQYKWRRKRAR